ncbi:MAG: J domain-containing protein [Bauldia sp.]|nr:J domain-containing protein [Bauldia sp.]
MNLNSKYFDRIRIHADRRAGETADSAPCEWQGCDRHGGYRAPKGRGREGEYHNLCLDHVREYNKSYNYFAGMADDDVIAWQRSAVTGHRPTWTMGVNPEGEKAARVHPNRAWASAFSDPFGIFGGGGSRRAPDAEPARRPLKNVERRSFAVLDLEGGEDGSEIKARYKTLVKRFHPDANGGDRSSEDRLRQIIQAYHYLKAAGFC